MSEVICKGARLKHINESLDFTSRSVWSQWCEAFAYLSPVYDKLFYVFNIVPVFLLILTFISPMYKGFEYYHHDNPRIHISNRIDDEWGEEEGDIRSYYVCMERRLASEEVPSVFVRAS